MDKNEEHQKQWFGTVCTLQRSVSYKVDMGNFRGGEESERNKEKGKAKDFYCGQNSLASQLNILSST